MFKLVVQVEFETVENKRQEHMITCICFPTHCQEMSNGCIYVEAYKPHHSSQQTAEFSPSEIMVIRTNAGKKPLIDILNHRSPLHKSYASYNLETQSIFRPSNMQCS